MPVYEYKAIDIKGKNASGVINSESALSVRQKLRNSGIFPVSIKEVDDIPQKKEMRTYFNLHRFNRVKPSEVSMMTRQLATLISAGFPLVTALDALIPQTHSTAFKKILSHVKDSIVEGNSFSVALSLYPAIFPPIHINMVQAGETSGTLDIVLERLADITEKQQALNNRIKSLLAYPVLMTFIGALVLFVLLTFIVPTITSIFSDMNQVLPTPTLLLITISDLLKSYWYVIIILIAAIILAHHNIKKTKKGIYLIDKTVLYLPGIGALVKKMAVARFARTLASLLENGVSMLSALEIAKNITGNVLISNAIEDAAKEVGKGQSLGASLAAFKAIPYLSIQMIQVGEQSGKLETMLNKIADLFENEVETTMISMTSLLEPAIILFMGVIIGFIVLSICLPIFEMNQFIM